MTVFACFAPSFSVKTNESNGFPKASDGGKKRSSKRYPRVKPIDTVNPSISDGNKKRKSKLSLRVKPIDIVIPNTIVSGKKKRSKWGLRVKPIDISSPLTKDDIKKRRSKWGFRIKAAEDCSMKRSSKWGLQVKPIDIVCPSAENETKELIFPVSKSSLPEEKIFFISPKIPSDDRLAIFESAGGTIFEVGDEHDEIHLVKADQFDLNLQSKGELAFHGSNTDLSNYVLEEKAETDEAATLQAGIASGTASDRWMEHATFINSLVLERSCSNIEIMQSKELVKSPERSNTYSNLQNLSGNGKVEIAYGTHNSPLSLLTPSNADYMMLKRLSSSRVLPSRSRKIWQKLFLWSNNKHKSTAPERLLSVLSDTNQEDVNSSNMLQHDRELVSTKSKVVELENQWVAFSSEYSHMDRVNAWVNSLEDFSFFPVDVEEDCDEVEDEEEIVQPTNIIKSLSSFSSVAHISGIGLKVLPPISTFVYLRSANLSGNCIVQITPGSLPKSLHTLDLSRNKISSIEGLRGLERLRVLNLSYNRITRIGHGLSSCTLIKELYLAGNKISVVEGLHRVLKLTVLDLGFNKITTAKALGQLVANYNCLLALNLTGNPIQANIGDDQLKKEILGLLPHVTFLNKQPIKPHKVLEVPTNSVAKAALGDGPRRKMTRRLSQDSFSLIKKRVGEGSSRPIKHRSKSMQSIPYIR